MTNKGRWYINCSCAAGKARAMGANSRSSHPGNHYHCLAQGGCGKTFRRTAISATWGRVDPKLRGRRYGALKHPPKIAKRGYRQDWLTLLRQFVGM